MTAGSRRAREAGASLARSFANPSLRRLQLAWLGSVLGNWSYIVALSVYAYDQGGAGAVGFVWLVRLVPAALTRSTRDASSVNGVTRAVYAPRRSIMPLPSRAARSPACGASLPVPAADGDDVRQSGRQLRAPRTVAG